MINYDNVNEITIHFSADFTQVIPIGTDGVSPDQIKEVEQLTSDLKLRLEENLKEILNMDDVDITGYQCFIGNDEPVAAEQKESDEDMPSDDILLGA